MAGLAGLTVGHVVEDVLHGAAVGQSARPHLAIGLLPPLALVCVEQQDQLLLNELALLGVGGRSCRHAAGPGDHAHRCHLLLHLGLGRVKGGFAPGREKATQTSVSIYFFKHFL